MGGEAPASERASAFFPSFFSTHAPAKNPDMRTTATANSHRTATGRPVTLTRLASLTGQSGISRGLALPPFHESNL